MSGLSGPPSFFVLVHQDDREDQADDADHQPPQKGGPEPIHVKAHVEPVDGNLRREPHRESIDHQGEQAQGQ